MVVAVEVVIMIVEVQGSLEQTDQPQWPLQLSEHAQHLKSG